MQILNKLYGRRNISMLYSIKYSIRQMIFQLMAHTNALNTLTIKKTIKNNHNENNLNMKVGITNKIFIYE